MSGMLYSIRLALMPLLLLALLSELAAVPAPMPTPPKVIYGGEDGCDCPKQLGYQLNVPRPKLPYEYQGNQYGYRVDKPVQTKAKFSYSFDFTVEQPRTPQPPKLKPAKLYAKVDRVLINKPDCLAVDKSKCSCSSCSAARPRYVVQPSSFGPNAIRRRRDLSSPGLLLRKRFMRQQQLQERPARYVKYYHKDLQAQQLQEQQQLEQQQQFNLFGLMPLPLGMRQTELEAPPVPTKRKTKKATDSLNAKKQSSQHRLQKRDIKGEYDLLELERLNTDLTAPEIIQFMPETLNPNFQRGQCHMGCGAPSASCDSTEQTSSSSRHRQQLEPAEQPTYTDPESEMPDKITLFNSVPAKRAAHSYYTQQLRRPLSGVFNAYKFIDDSKLLDLLSTSSVRDPFGHSSKPLRFVGDLESLNRRNYAATHGYPVEHVPNGQLDNIITDLVYNHPEQAEDFTHYEGSLVEPGPVQKEQTKDFIKKLFDGRLGGWGFDSADYPPTPTDTYDYESHQPSGYSSDSYNTPAFGQYLRSWF